MAIQFPRLFYDNIAMRKDANLNLIVPDASITATDYAGADFVPSNTRDARKFTRWRGQGITGPKQHITDYGSNTAVDYVVIYGHNLSGMNVSIESAASGGGFTTRVSTFVPANNNIIVKEFSQVTHRHYRVTIDNLGSTEPEAGEIWWGPAFVLPLYLPMGFDPRPYDSRSASYNSVEGHILGADIDFIRIGWDFELWPVSYVFAEATGFPSWTDFVKRCYNLREPFFFAWDTGDHPQDTYFVQVPPDEPAQQKWDRNLRRLKLRMTGKTEDFE